MYNFQNKLILITGATSGMGLVALENIIEFGGKVIVTGSEIPVDGGLIMR